MKTRMAIPWQPSMCHRIPWHQVYDDTGMPHGTKYVMTQACRMAHATCDVCFFRIMNERIKAFTWT